MIFDHRIKIEILTLILGFKKLQNFAKKNYEINLFLLLFPEKKNFT